MKAHNALLSHIWEKKILQHEDLPLTHVKFQPGDLVYLQWHAKEFKKRHLVPRNFGPFIVMKALPHGSVVIKISNGTLRKVNAAHLRKLDLPKVNVDEILVDNIDKLIEDDVHIISTEIHQHTNGQDADAEEADTDISDLSDEELEDNDNSEEDAEFDDHFDTSNTEQTLDHRNRSRRPPHRYQDVLWSLYLPYSNLGGGNLLPWILLM